MYEPNVELLDALIEELKMQIVLETNDSIVAEKARQLESYILLKNHAREVQNG